MRLPSHVVTKLVPSTSTGLALKNVSSGDFIDAFIDHLRESSPGSKCFDEDTIRSCLTEMLDGEDE